MNGLNQSSIISGGLFQHAMYMKHCWEKSGVVFFLTFKTNTNRQAALNSTSASTQELLKAKYKKCYGRIQQVMHLNLCNQLSWTKCFRRFEVPNQVFSHWNHRGFLCSA